MCIIVAYPSVRRVGLIKSLANYLACVRPENLEKEFGRQMQKQRDAMARRGLSDKVIDNEMRALERAIRAALWHVQLYGGAA